jgi:hypothetical protein
MTTFDASDFEELEERLQSDDDYAKELAENASENLGETITADDMRQALENVKAEAKKLGVRPAELIAEAFKAIEGEEGKEDATN